MKALQLEKPHGFLLWKGKQTAIAHKEALPIDDPVIICCDGEAYGEATLAPAEVMNVTEFERLQKAHCVRPEERKLWWPEATTLFMHRLKNWQPYEVMQAVDVVDGEAVLREAQELTEDEQKLLHQIERLPKQITLSQEAVCLCGDKAVMGNGINCDLLQKILDVTLSGVGLSDDKSMALYHLALVKTPHPLIEKKKEIEATTEREPATPDNIVNNQEETMPDNDTATTCNCEGKCADCPQTIEIVEMSQLEDEDKAKKPDITPNSIRVRVAPPGKFQEGTFRTIDVGKDTGIQAVVGKLQGEDTMTIQTYIFDKERWKPDEAAAWVDEHKDSKTDDLEAEEEKKPVPKKDEKAGKRLGKGMVDKLKSMFEMVKEMLTWANYEDNGEEEDPEEEEMLTGEEALFGKMVAVKQVNGEPWFFAWSTNAFIDREQEIFSTKSLENYVKEAEKKQERGFFNLWHIPNTDFAKKEWQGVIGRFLVEAGPFLPDTKGQAARKFFEAYPDGHPELAPEGWGCSPEYRYLAEERVKGVYDWVWITRTSTLPRAAAANVLTKGGIMALTKQQKEAAAKIFGDELAGQIIAEAEQESKDKEAAGVAHKDKPVDPIPAQEEPQQPVITVEAVAEVLMKQLSANLSPLGDSITSMEEAVKAISDRLEKLEKDEAVKAKVETPRFELFLKRASGAVETQVAEGDKLANEKPAETKPKPVDQSGAAHFFGHA